MSQETVFLYKSGAPKTDVGVQNVRRRLQAAQPEAEVLSDRRVRRYMHAREIIDTTFAELGAHSLDESLEDLVAFARSTATDEQLPVSILLNSDVAAFTAGLAAYPLFRHVTLHSKECPNAKTTIKLIVNRFTENEITEADRRLTYDFDVLAEWALPSTHLLVFIDDTDSFDFDILRQLMAQMHSYRQRLCMHLCLNVGIPLPLFEENLSQDNVVNARVQYLTNSVHPQALVEAVVPLLEEIGLYVKDELVATLSQLEIRQCVSYLRYCVLAHFAGNPFAVAADMDSLAELPSSDRLPSMQKNPQRLEDVEEVRLSGRVLDAAFNPHYRPLIEQSLTNVELYADGGAQNVPLACLYQLQRESSVYINIYDLYMAFKQMVGRVGPDENWDRQSMAIFLECTAALKLIGVIRDCKRKFECVEKVSWTGV